MKVLGQFSPGVAPSMHAGPCNQLIWAKDGPHWQRAVAGSKSSAHMTCCMPTIAVWVAGLLVLVGKIWVEVNSARSSC